MTKKAKSNELKSNALSDFVGGVLGAGFAPGINNWYGAELSKANTLAWNNRYSAITMNRSLITELYQEHGIVQVLVDQPVDDAFRGGIDIIVEEFGPDDIKKLNTYIEQNNILLTYAQGLKWARLFGGAGVIINSGQDTQDDFDIEKVGPQTQLEFYAADRWELNYSPSGLTLDQFNVDKNETPYNYYGHRLNKTHVIKLMGKIAPSLIRGQFGGWGVSELERLVRPYNMFLKHQDVVFELLDESKVDVFKIQGFNSSIASRDGAALTAKRISVASKIKNYQNALVVDKEDDYEQKQLSFGGLSEILKEIRIDLASECRMPMTKLFGISAAGFNAGEDDIENYNAMIETEIRSKVKAGLLLMIKICCKHLFDYVPENIEFEWKPLRIMSEKDESAIKNEQLNRIMQAYSQGLMPTEVAVDQVNAAKIFPIGLSSSEAMTLEEMAELQSSQSVGSVGGFDATMDEADAEA